MQCSAVQYSAVQCRPYPQARLQAHHAAMDFSSPAGGRIISDPREAAALAAISRTGPSARPPPASGTTSLASSRPPPSPAQSARSPGPGPAWLRTGMGREQANLALFPHRATPGLFLVRACSRREGGFVLSFTTQVSHRGVSKAIHCAGVNYTI
jgi:hypothetical protein